ncbi:hypothetical protein RA27_15185 [Ruegeria sp. ANG-R]|uniref:hypothetical protein n=1 Tax=Ruegeria sp. ANG-R TaxID=1577903 RepID=UPI00057CCAAA|nr:hypothetical protein [Ruegeria sp. ANG-R]KIC40170.1 hypothetical protein RA27_15185 [Ruegeria sp. ANG-R]
MFVRYRAWTITLICGAALIIGFGLFFDPIRLVRVGPGPAISVRTIAEVGPRPVAGKIDPYLDVSVQFQEDGEAGQEYSYHLRLLEDFKFAGGRPWNLWLATMRPDWPQHPDISPIIGNSCLEPHNGEALTGNRKFALSYSEYVVCRVVADKPDGFEGTYNEDAYPKAVIGLLWGTPNHQPVSMSEDRCAAEARIWAATIARPDDRFVLCVMVVDSAEGVVDIYAYELSSDYISALSTNGSGASQRWRLKPTKQRESKNLQTYRQIQDWVKNDNGRAQALKVSGPGIIDAASELRPSRDFRFVKGTLSDQLIILTIEVRHPEEYRTWTGNSAVLKAANWLRQPLCKSEYGAALLAYQQNVTSFRVIFVKPDGSPLMETWIPPMLC